MRILELAFALIVVNSACTSQSAHDSPHNTGGGAGRSGTVDSGGEPQAIPTAGASSSNAGASGAVTGGSAATGSGGSATHAGSGGTGEPPHVPGPFDGTGDLRDGNLRFVGRWSRADETVARSYWGGAYLRIAFEGSELAVDVEGGATFILDGAITTPATNGDAHDLAPALTSAGPHDLLVVAANQNLELTLRGLTLGSDTKTLPLTKRPLIEIIGDSITTGAGPDFSSLLPYSWLTGEALESDHTQISFSGAALTSGFGFTTDKSGMDEQYFRLKNFNHEDADNAAWDFAAYQADLVVINLGTNDAGEPPATFQSSYEKFLVDVRSKHPHAEVAALRPFNGSFSSQIAAAVSARAAAGDAKVHFIDTTGWLASPSDFTDGTHPTPEGHQKVAAKLTPLLRPYLR